MKHVAIIGGGQLARMLALAGIPMGIRFSFLLEEDQEDSCVYLLGDCVRYKKEDSYESIYLQLGCPEVITVESENVDVNMLRGLGKFTKVHPSPDAVETFADRIKEKLYLSSRNVNTSRYFPFYNYQDLIDNIGMLKFPVVLKAAQGGYDGKHQIRIPSPEILEVYNEPQLEKVDFSSGYIAEEFLQFEREISLIAVRSVDGKVLFYPPTENIHHRAVLATSIAPAKKLDRRELNKAKSWITELMDHYDYVGVLAVECFLLNEDGQQKLCVNELSPRVHNSGHWTQSACATSQFENHVRAILGLPLGSVKHFGHAAMVNILGKQKVNLDYLPHQASLHWYDKTERAGRKMGHINLRGESSEKLSQELGKINQFLSHDFGFRAPG